MEVPQREDDLSDVKSHFALLEAPSISLQVSKELSARLVVNDEEEVGSALEAGDDNSAPSRVHNRAWNSPEFETDEEGAVESPGEDLSLCKDLCQIGAALRPLLRNDLHSVDTLRIPLAHAIDDSKVALADLSEN